MVVLAERERSPRRESTKRESCSPDRVESKRASLKSVGDEPADVEDIMAYKNSIWTQAVGTL